MPMREVPWLALLAFVGCGSAASRPPPGPTSPDASEDSLVAVPADAAGEDRPRDLSVTPELDAPPPPDQEEPALDGPSPDVAAGPGFENSLGMRFLPLPGAGVMISIWETRVRDFEAYATATGAAVPHPDFPETALQPKAAVSRQQAEAFATWLTGKEQSAGTITSKQRYRLPTDAEWDAAIGGSGGPFPWGSGFPPPDHFANYGLTKDGFTYTAPVGSFPPNRLGLYDLAGNLWEWIGQGCRAGGAYLVRGAGWNAAGQSYLTVDFHYCFGADLVGHHNVGFRLVLEGRGS
jgi:hypothetical protein